MWAVVDSGLCSWADLKTHVTLEEFARMCLHLKKKSDAARQQQQQASARAHLREVFGR